ncbi:MAG: hypothetical protein DRN95_02190 [Candidatus Hydrothermarchaeota archaeon]|nr:MAG: hypothetical protein DRN95_02190 [Candidatus Hydrothermarchaeota archaeon]
MSEEKERYIYSLLQKFEGTLYLKNKEGLKEIGRVRSERRGFGGKKGRPDFILWIELDLDILKTRLRTEFPILVEEEDEGISNVERDYSQFLREGKLFVPMIVVGGEERKETLRSFHGLIKVELFQIPFPLVK